MTRTPDLRELASELEEAVVAGVDQAKVWLDSPRGRRYRSLAAKGLVLAAPIILKHPFFRTPIGRLVGVAGGAALVAKVADLVRDWEPSGPSSALQTAE